MSSHGLSLVTLAEAPNNRRRNEELSNDELKEFRGGVSGEGIEIPRATNRQKKGRNPNDPPCSGVAQKDWRNQENRLYLCNEKVLTSQRQKVIHLF